HFVRKEIAGGVSSVLPPGTAGRRYQISAMTQFPSVLMTHMIAMLSIRDSAGPMRLCGASMTKTLVAVRSTAPVRENPGYREIYQCKSNLDSFCRVRAAKTN